MSEYDDSDYDPEQTVNAIDQVHSELTEIHSVLDEVNSTLKEILSTRNSQSGFSGVLGVVFFFCLLSIWSGSKPDRFTDRLWYSIRYGTEWKDITVNKRPFDCDFIQSPLGAKGCEYKKQTNVFGEKERQELVRGATTVEAQQSYAKLPDSVIVYWEKKEH